MTAIHRTVPGYRVDDFLTAMQMDAPGAALYRQAAKRLAG
jgi:hypothetical protein